MALISQFLARRGARLIGRILQVGGGTLVVAAGTWVASQSWYWVIPLSLIIGLALLFEKGMGDRDSAELAEAFVVVFLVAFVVAGIVAGVFLLPLPLLLLIGWWVAVTLTPVRFWWVGLVVASMVVIGGYEQHGWLVALAVPVVFAGYYRLFPFYPALAIMTLWRSLRMWFVSGDTLQWWLLQLPPHLDELVWFPLPGHRRILMAAFRYDAVAAGETWLAMQASPFAGFRTTANKATAQIVADELRAVATTADIVAVTRTSHPVLPIVVPMFYQEEGDREQSGMEELDRMVPRLFSHARDIQAARDNTHIGLRQRGLMDSLDKLGLLEKQLPGLGLAPRVQQRWRSVIEQWQSVIAAEIEGQVSSTEEVFNPFQPGNPLRRNRSDLFKGRTTLVEDIVRRLLDRSRPTLVLHGPRRCGKTSFLLHLPRLLSSDVHPVYLDMQDETVVNSESDFWYRFVRAIRRDVHHYIDLPAISKEAFLKDPYSTLGDWMEEALPMLEGHRLLLCIDEFEKLGEAIGKGRLTLRLFNQLRNLIQHAEQMNFLFCGVQTLDEMGPNWSNYFISVYPIEISPYLNKDEAYALLTEPDPDFNLGYDDGVIERILELTRCQPYLVQLLGETLVVEANRRSTKQATMPMLETAIDSALTKGQPYFDVLWKEYTGITEEEIAAGQEMLLALVRTGHMPPPADAAAQKALDRLLRFHTIEEYQENYRFEVPLVERWVRERAYR